VDDQARQVVRLEAHLSDAYKLAGGLLASIRKGPSRVMEQAKTNEEVWLPSSIEAHFSARLLLVSSALGDYTSKFSDYKKFRVVTVTGTEVSVAGVSPPPVAVQHLRTCDGTPGKGTPWRAPTRKAREG